ncbi:hypothetical protein C2G38_2032172 [Gigaspora rosea]|uniref:Uncharacterized protein n=1 Tax=Gigaspora rosea TaxID=44941 RepID=A0A397VSU9_9GLOM|nr:hypothetical protein C2G38_2032172 [Gigaspora rosea]
MNFLDKEKIEEIKKQIVKAPYHGIVTKILENNLKTTEVIVVKEVIKEIIVQKKEPNQTIIKTEVSPTKRKALINTNEAAEYFVYKELKTQFEQGILPTFRYSSLLLKARKFKETKEFLEEILEKAPHLKKEYFLKENK